MIPENDVLGDVDVDADHVLQNVLTVTGHGREPGVTSMRCDSFCQKL